MAEIVAGGRPVCLVGTVGSGGALTDLLISVASDIAGATSMNWLNGAALDVASYALPATKSSGSAVGTTPASGTFYLFLKAGAASYTISAKGTGTTLQVVGTVL